MVTIFKERFLTAHRHTASRLAQLVIVLMAAVTLSACASTQNSAEFGEVYDPIEPVNRQIFAFNDAVDEVALEPAAEVYRDTLPETIRTGIANILRNLRTPLIFGNQVLQGDMEGAGTALVRFVTNTLAGLGGFLDPAGENGFEFEEEDFGQTLAVWGVGEGPYMVLPLLGPSNLRDTVGFVVDIVTNPVGILIDNQHVGGEYAIASSTATALTARSESLDAIREIKSSSVDYYASLRNLYNQRRANLIADGAVSVDIPDFSEMSDEELDQADNAEELDPSILVSARPAELVD